MLKGIPLVLSPDLLKTLAEMGHGDRIVLGDAYFASAAMAEKNRLLRADGVSSLALVDAILQLMPLDGFVVKPVTIMDKMEMHRDLKCPVWDEFTDIVA